MSADTFEWVGLGPASWVRGIDGMAAESLFRACGPEGGRIDPIHGPQVRRDILERIQADHLAYQDDQRRYREYTDDGDRKRAEHIGAALGKAREKFIRGPAAHIRGRAATRAG